MIVTLSRAFEPCLKKLLQSDDQFEREAGVETLSLLESEEAIPALLPLLQDKEVRQKVAMALGQLKAQEIIPEMHKRLV